MQTGATYHPDWASAYCAAVVAAVNMNAQAERVSRAK